MSTTTMRWARSQVPMVRLWDLYNERPIWLPASEVCTDPPADMNLGPLLAELTKQEGGAVLCYRTTGQQDKEVPVVLRTLGECQPGEKVLVPLGSDDDAMSLYEVEPSHLRDLIGPDNCDRIVFCSGLALAADMSALAVKLLEMVGAQVPAELVKAAAAERAERDGAQR